MTRCLSHVVRLIAAAVLAVGVALPAAAHFDPVLGRWLERDPAGYVDGMNRYSFASDQPAAFSDAWGLQVDSYIYGVDGLFQTSGSNTNIIKFILRVQGTKAQRHYWGWEWSAGAFLNNTVAIDTVYEEICKDYCNDIDSRSSIPPDQYKGMQINLIGWSRGGMVVIGAARRLHDDGCECTSKVGDKCTYKPNVNWIGLIDAVDNTPLQWSDDVTTAYAKTVSHALKTFAYQRELLIFPTMYLTVPNGSELRQQRFGTRQQPIKHAQMGWSANVLDWLISEAKRAGVNVQ